MANITDKQKANLVPWDDMPEEEVRKLKSAGGKASGEAKRRKKALRECLEVLLEKQMETDTGDKVSGAEALAISLFQKALEGDVRAWEVLRDTAGQKPADKVVVSEVDKDVMDEVESMVALARAKKRDEDG